jgi:DNA-binding NarL/FixJ family response regulator
MQQMATAAHAASADGTAADMITVGIVEDNSGLRRHLKSLFEGAPGFRCSAALASAEEAIEAIPCNPPDVLLMDINLPGMSGIACAAHLKGRLPSLQIVMITVYDDPETVFRALKAGACGYLLKRSTPKEILRAVSDVHAGGRR